MKSVSKKEKCLNSSKKHSIDGNSSGNVIVRRQPEQVGPEVGETVKLVPLSEQIGSTAVEHVTITLPARTQALPLGQSTKA